MNGTRKTNFFATRVYHDFFLSRIKATLDEAAKNLKAAENLAAASTAEIASEPATGTAPALTAAPAEGTKKD